MQTLTASLVNGNQNQQMDILKFMACFQNNFNDFSPHSQHFFVYIKKVEENQALPELVKRLVSSWISSNRDELGDQVSSLLVRLRNVLLVVQGSDTNESVLHCTIQHLIKGQFEDAERSAFPGLQGLGK